MERVEQLLGVLRSRGLLRGAEIQRALGISQPVMSRLIREAGSRVCRFGRSVATRYAVPREVNGIGRQAPVFRVDDRGQAHRHGVLHFLAGGGTWLERVSGDGQAFPELPPFLEDMRLQGYIGRRFPARYPELTLPSRITDWNDDHHVIALASRGEDCVGNLIIGEESLDRFLSQSAQHHPREDYPRLAAGALAGQPGSSAGGEHPKFVTSTEERGVLVKFAAGDGGAADRWRDLLVCEHLALEVLQEAEIPVPRSACFDVDGSRYLELERFDRIGRKGRRGVISLYALNCHYLGEPFDSWSRATQRIVEEPTLSLDADQAERLVWLDTFGDLIGNTDRHFGNCCFFAEEARQLSLTLAPVYDMLPMVFAPADGNLVERPFAPRPPSTLNLHVWHQAASLAQTYWSRLCQEERLSPGFRLIAANCRETLSKMVDQQR